MNRHTMSRRRGRGFSGSKVVENGRGIEVVPGVRENGSQEQIDVERVMDVWVRVCDKVKERLRDGKHPYDPRLYQEWELALAVDLIHGGFRFGNGSVPNELKATNSEEVTSPEMLWNFPEFAREIERRAREAGLSTEEFMQRAFVPLLNHKEDAGSMTIGLLLGGEFLNRQDVREIFEGLRNHNRTKKAKLVKQEPEDPLELPVSLEKISPV